MSDNVTVGSNPIATDDVGGVQYQKVKLDVGGDGVSAPLSSSNPLPISDAGGTITVDGTVSVQLKDGSGNSLTSKAPGSERALSVAIVDGSGNQVTSFTGSGGTSGTDDAAFTPGSTGVTPVAGTYRSSRDSVDDNDMGALAMTIKRALLACLETPLGDSAMDDTNDSVKVSIVSDSVGSTVDADSNAVVVGNVAHDGADSRAPVKIGAKATAALSGVTLVAAADRTDLFAGLDGVIITRPYCNLEDIVSGVASNTDGASTEVIAAQAAGIKTYLTSVSLINMHASTDAYVELKDGTTVKWRGVVPHASGLVANFPVPLPGTAATAWNFDPSAAVTTLYCSLIGFKSKI